LYLESVHLEAAGVPQKPVYPPVTDKDVNIVDRSKPFDTIGEQVIKDIIDIANNQKCSDAFKKYGLRIPYDLLLSDKIKIVPHGFLYNDEAARTLGISQDLVDSIRYDLSTGIIFWGKAAATVSGSNPIIVIGPSATLEDYGGLKSVLIHELIHAGGKAGSGDGVNGDLTGFDGYKEIQAACGGKSN
jgi:hypothetical protein